MTNAPSAALRWQPWNFRARTSRVWLARCVMFFPQPLGCHLQENRDGEMQSAPSLCKSCFGASRHREGVVLNNNHGTGIYLLFHLQTAKPHRLRLNRSWDWEMENTIFYLLSLKLASFLCKTHFQPVPASYQKSWKVVWLTRELLVNQVGLF